MDEQRRFNPWVYVPLLYVMQAIPVTVVQELSVYFYKDFGVANEKIAIWTSLIALPWSLQLLLGPLVDLNGTKRRWILGGQAVIAAGLIGLAILFHLPNPFAITLLVLAATAITSALCNIATDGFYILSLSRDQQAGFVGVQSTCYRLGRLFCIGLLVWVVGLLMSFKPVHVAARSGQIVLRPGVAVSQVDLTVAEGFVESVGGIKLDPLMPAPSGVYGMRVLPDGEVRVSGNSGEESVGRLTLTGTDGVDPAPPSQSMSPAVAWSSILLLCGVLFLIGWWINRRTVPRPSSDIPAADPSERQTLLNVYRSLLLVAAGLFGYFFLSAITRLIAEGLYSGLQGRIGLDLSGWNLPGTGRIFGADLHLGGIGAEVFQLIACGLILSIVALAGRRLFRGSAMADALTSYITQQGFPAILFFVLFYRFGEAMVGKMSPLFLKDSVSNGGLGLSNAQLGPIKGFAGVAGIIAGGLVGGWVVSKLGLRRSFWPLAICMHVPNLLYLWASYVHPATPALYGIEFADQFGYGFGFAAYTVYLMWVAQRGNYKTSHYAIGAGMGALCIATAGITSGMVQKNFGYQGFFWSVILLSLPGLLSLLFIPIDQPAKLNQG